MAKSKVYFTDFRTRVGVSQGIKLQKLCRAAGIADIDGVRLDVVTQGEFLNSGAAVEVAPAAPPHPALCDNRAPLLLFPALVGDAGTECCCCCCCCCC